MEAYSADGFFSLEDFLHKDLFADQSHVWGGLRNLKEYMNGWTYTALPEWIQRDIPLSETVIVYDNEWMPATGCEITFGDAPKGELLVKKDGAVLEGASVVMAGVVLSGNNFDLGKGVLIEAGAFLQSPIILGDRSVVRHGAYLRGYCLVGRRCVLGHVTEVKHTIFMDDAKAGHFAYLGDSMLGHNVNLGAGTKLANLRFVKGDVRIKTKEGFLSTGLRKMGAILGDNVQTGCNSVTNPGTLLGKNSMVLPCVMVPSGFHTKHSIIR